MPIEQPPFTIAFHDNSGRVIGTLSVVSGKLHFEGDVDESAKLFFECVCKVYDREVEAMTRELRGKMH